MRDDKWRGCCHSKLEDKVIIWISQERPPREKNLLVISQKANAVKNSQDIHRTKPRHHSRSQRNRLVLEHQSNRHGNPDVAPANRPQNLKAGSVP